MSRKQGRCILILMTIMLYITGCYISVHAESGTVYSCTINRSYGNPVTGEVEDSGGESSYATGQGMVESAVYSQGLMEVTDSGNYYLTIRLSLLDYTSGHTFAVQNVGDSGWMDTATAVTANGSDSSGSTADICMQVPSENCIVRITMYVSPMGRNAVFYIYPTNYSEGNSVGMSPYFVTKSGESGTSYGSDNNSGYVTDQTETMQNTAVQQGSNNDSSQASAVLQNAGNDAQQNTGQTETNTALTKEDREKQADQGQSSDKNNDTSDTAETADSVKTADSTETAGTAKTTDSAKAANLADSEDSASETELNNAQGLSLSTASESPEVESEKFEAEIFISPYFMMGLTIVISGLILILAAALVVWYFRRNWRRWGGEDDYDEED